MIFIPRHVKLIHTSFKEGEEPQAVLLTSFRSDSAWVLLGEPGAGKSQAFDEEAAACGGLKLEIAHFITGEILDEWRNRCLFLDGLDEVRASGSDRTILNQVRSRLITLGRPPFRISCRAADWYGQSDREDILGATPNGDLDIYALEPLRQADIKRILETNFAHADADQFIEQATRHGIVGLLSNPQTLKLTVKALEGNTWPADRNATYQLACESLVKEENKNHRNHARFQPASKEKLLEAAGQIFATLLLSDKSGVALDQAAANARFQTFTDFDPASTELAASALATNLFVQSPGCEERLESSHRSIAEYLGAQWLGSQIDAHGLPLPRVLNLMRGFDGKTVAGLRGIYGWLALHSLKARATLIKNDPLTVALYSDPQPMDLASRRQLLRELHAQVRESTPILWELRGAENLAPLFHPELRDEFIAALREPGRDDASQTFAVFALKILQQVGVRADVTDDLKKVAADDSRWERVRRHALEAWLDISNAEKEVIDFLNQLNQSKISDPADELMGVMLDNLFPSRLPATDVLRYLRIPKSEISGVYQHFWAYRFPKTIHSDDLPVALEKLTQRNDLRSLAWDEFHLSRMIAALVSRGVNEHGDTVSDATLFSWLTLGANEYGEVRHDNEYQAAIVKWLSTRPDRYKGLLGICFSRHEENPAPLNALFNDSQVLRGIVAPPDIGLWHFQKISKTNNEVLAKEHLSGAVRSLWSDQGSNGLTFEMVLDWAREDPIKLGWLESELVWPIQDWRMEQNTAIQQRNLQQRQIMQDRSLELAKRIEEIKAGGANPGLMGELAGVWGGQFIDTRGDAPLDRFKGYCNNYQEVFEATKVGLQACLNRSDLPSVTEIIDVSLKGRGHFIRKACLIGADLLWSEAPSAFEALSQETLERLVCFRLTDGTDKTPNWFVHLAKNSPIVVSRVLTKYASTYLKAKKDYVDGIYLLSENADFKQVAKLTVPALLRTFPTRNKLPQLHHLRLLLIAALKYAVSELPDIVARKLQLKSLEPAQKVYWLLTGTIIDPGNYEKDLWDFVGQSWQRVQHLSDFLGSRFSDLPVELTLSAKTLGKFIEIQTPFAQVDWPPGGGSVSQAMSLGDHVNGLIGKLSALGTLESLDEINRLIDVPSLEKVKRRLQSGKHEVIQKIREYSFDFPTFQAVIRILNNRAPTSPADLHAITLDHLDQIAFEIRTSNSDQFRQFWTEGKTNKHKSENSCRDALLTMLNSRLTPLGISSDPEVDYVNDKRADIRVSYRDLYAVPIEIKGEWHPQLWTAIQGQLIPQYTSTKETAGYGVFLVLWIGGNEQAAPRDGGKKAVNPDELQQRLAALVPPALIGRIAVRVLNVSWPH